MVGYPVPDPGNPVPDPGTRFRTRVPGSGPGYPGTRVPGYPGPGTRGYPGPPTGTREIHYRRYSLHSSYDTVAIKL